MHKGSYLFRHFQQLPTFILHQLISFCWLRQNDIVVMALKLFQISPRPLSEERLQRCFRTNVRPYFFSTFRGGGAGAYPQKYGYRIANVLLYSYLVPRETLLYIFIFLVCNDSGNKSTKVRKWVNTLKINKLQPYFFCTFAHECTNVLFLCQNALFRTFFNP